MTSPEARVSSQLQTALVLTEVSQPKLPEKKKKLGGLRGVAVKGTLFFTGAGLVIGACTPAQRAILEGAFPCAPGPIAGAADGNTAVIENPNQITISGNIFDDKKEAKVCLPTGQTVSVEPTPTPKPTPEATPSGPAPDSFEVLLDSKIDPKVTFEDVFDDIDDLYATEEYKEPLKRITSFYSETTHITKKKIVDYLKKCRDEVVKSSRQILCSGNVVNFILYARQFPLSSGNPIDAAINVGFVELAQDTRSVAVNDKVPKKQLDRDIKLDGEFYDDPANQ